MNYTNTLDSIEETSRERKQHKTSTESMNKLKSVMQCDNLKCDDATNVVRNVHIFFPIRSKSRGEDTADTNENH